MWKPCSACSMEAVTTGTEGTGPSALSQNPLRTRADTERALLRILEPVKGRFTAGNAGLHLGDFAAHYGENSAHMEAFSRMLWGQGGGGEYLPLFRRGLVNGTDPDHPAYWGRWGTMTKRLWRWRPSP